MKNNLIICIGRQYGSGGRDVGKLLSDNLKIPYYDKELIYEMAKQSGISKELLNVYDEKPTNSLLYSLSMGTYNYGTSLNAFADLPINDKIYFVQNDTIKKLAKNSCVIIGRCAANILNNNFNVLSVFIHCDIDKRIERISKVNNISNEEALALIKKTDKKRAAYHNYYCENKWGEASSYDISINSKIGIEKTAEIILSTIKYI